MKTIFSIISVCMLSILPCFAQDAQVDVASAGVTVEIQWFNPQCVRILKTPTGKTMKKESLSVIAKPESVKYKKSEANGTITMTSSSMSVSLDKTTGLVSFSSKGKYLISEKATSDAFTPFNDAGNPTYSVKQMFQTDPAEGLYGLGQLQNHQMMQRNMTKLLAQNNTEDFSPVIQSTKGYGIFWDNYSATTYSDKVNGQVGETSFSSQVGDCIDYYFMYGGSADNVIACIRQLTGEVPMMPLWSYGFMQSKERYKSQDETVGVVRKYRELGIPLDVIIQDWQYWGNNYLWNAMEFNNPDFDRPQQFVDEVHGLNAKMMISIWQSFGPQTKQYAELDKEGLLFDIATWPQSGLSHIWPPRMDYPSGVRVYNPYSDKAREIYWKYLSKGLFSYGIDGWWMDSTEPDHFDQKESDFDAPTPLGTFRSVRNAFPLMCVGGVSEQQKAESRDKRVIILTRSGFLGQQRYGSNVWSGDVQSSWDMLRKQVTAGLNFSLTGMPHWNSDLGGFFCGSYNNGVEGGAPKNPMFHELYVRWLQFGVFTPMMRSHGADAPREFYLYGKAGEPIYDALVDAVKLRYRLLPYIYSTSWQVTKNNSTFMRALFMDFINDKNVYDIKDEYMFGKSLLVAPIVNAQYTPELIQKDLKENDGWSKDSRVASAVPTNVDFTSAKSRGIYLPEGAAWYDFWTNTVAFGGQVIMAETSIDKIPFFVKAGSILPIGPDVQYSSEKKWDDLVINVYPGADAEFTLYEDEGDNYNYENGAYSTITFKWNDKSRTLTIGDRKGSFDGMLASRKFTVNVIGGYLTEGATRTVTYSGKKTTLNGFKALSPVQTVKIYK